jgi:hypothetical protein
MATLGGRCWKSGVRERIREGAQAQSSLKPKQAEFEIFASGRAEIGQNTPDAKLYCQTLPRNTWENGHPYPSIRNLVAVHRLREVSCLYGFTRFEAAPTSTDGDIEDIGLAVRGAPISEGADWLPAVEQFGEGLFIHFDERNILEWLGHAHVLDRQAKLLHGFEKRSVRYGKSAPRYPSTAYYLLHSLSHALMQEIALDCGYPASSLKERVYAHSSDQGGMVDRCPKCSCGATAGNQGTLGGLVELTRRFVRILKSALERERLCSGATSPLKVNEGRSNTPSVSRNCASGSLGRYIAREDGQASLSQNNNANRGS